MLGTLGPAGTHLDSDILATYNLGHSGAKQHEMQAQSSKPWITKSKLNV